MALGKVVVDQSFWDLFPDAKINVMFINNFKNESSDLTEADREKMLNQAVKASSKFTQVDPFRKNPVIAQWREAYQKFPKRKGARASVEALLKRANKGHVFDPINPLVDMYNAISMTYGVPVGIEDADSIDGDMHLGKAKGGEAFVSVGGDGNNESDPAREGEIIYYDNDGAVCRSLNWRDSSRTQLNDDTTNAVVVIESVNDDQAKRALEAMNQLDTAVEQYFKVQPSQVFTLTKDAPEAARQA